MKSFCVVSGAVLIAAAVSGAVGAPDVAGAAAVRQVSVIPLPNRVDFRTTDTFSLKEKPALVMAQIDPGIAKARQVIEETFSSPTKLMQDLKKDSADGAEGNRSITFARLKAESGETTASERYRLKITSASVELSAPTDAGLFYGAQTLRQMIAAAYAQNGAAPTLPACDIDDAPRYPWRGFMLDCSRHFMKKEFVERVLDMMALHKLNRFHWHLIDNNGWRMEVAAYPKLTSMGAWRGPENARYGGFYTKADIKEIVAYAAERHITVVPEFEMPGHSNAAIYAYPELSCSGQQLEGSDDERARANEYLNWLREPNGQPPVCAGNENTFKFEETVLTEAFELFPSAEYHIGGDERARGFWENCPKCQARMKEVGAKDAHELQTWFMRRMTAWMAEHGKRVVSWSVERGNAYDPTEVDDLQHDSIVQNWHGVTTLGARRGMTIINSDSRSVYFDYPELTKEGKPRWMSITPIEKVYAFSPTPAELQHDEQARVIGAEACLWTELVPQEKVDDMLFPRLFALAEIEWTAAERKNWDAFRARMLPHAEWLRKLGARIRNLE